MQPLSFSRTPVCARLLLPESFAEGVGNKNEGVGNIAEGVGNIAEGVGKLAVGVGKRFPRQGYKKKRASFFL